jgi:hypothetical protein
MAREEYEQENGVPEEKETKIRQVRVVVKDLDKTTEYLSSLGVGPFTGSKVTHPAATVHGEKFFYQVRLAKPNKARWSLYGSNSKISWNK